MKIASMTKWQLFMLSSSLLSVYPTLSRPLPLFLFCLLLSSCSIDKFLWVSFRVWWKFQIINYVAQFCFSFYAGNRFCFPFPCPLPPFKACAIPGTCCPLSLYAAPSVLFSHLDVNLNLYEWSSIWQRERRLPTHRKCLFSCCCCCCCC